MRKYKQEVDGLTKIQRYRAKDVDGYRKRKAEYARSPEERAKRTAYMRIWRNKNREKHNASAREYHYRHKDTIKLRNRQARLARYGLTAQMFDEMVERQNGQCGICGTDKPARNLFHIDHDHETGRVRMLLCSRCNGSLGWFEKYRQSILSYADTTW